MTLWIVLSLQHNALLLHIVVLICVNFPANDNHIHAMQQHELDLQGSLHRSILQCATKGHYSLYVASFGEREQSTESCAFNMHVQHSMPAA